MNLVRVLGSALLAAALFCGQAALADQQSINTGAAPNDRTGDNLRAAFGKANSNFSDLYGTTVPHVPTLAALKTFNPDRSPVVERNGYLAFGDSPKLRFNWNAVCPTNTPDNRAGYVASTVSGKTGGCWSGLKDTVGIKDLRNWGSVNDSTAQTCGTDNHDAIQAAFDTLGTGAELYNDGWSCTKATVTVSKSGAGVLCRGNIGGSGGHHDFTSNEFTGVSGFIGYTYGATLFKYKTSTNESLHGVFMECNLSGNAINPTYGQSAYGIQAYSVRNGHFKIAGFHFQNAIFEADIDPDLMAGFAAHTSDAAGSAGNDYWIYMDQGLQFDGAGFVCNGTTDWDCSQDNFWIVYGVWSGANGMVVLNGADSESLFNVSGYNARTGGDGCGIKLSASNDVDTARNNNIYFVAFSNVSCTVYAEGTENGKTHASGTNNIYQYDSLDSPIQPTIGVGAKLNWGTYNTPIGTNYFTQNGVTLSQRSSNGIITNSGQTGNIAPSSSQAITITGTWAGTPAAGAQLYFPNGCLTYTATPTSAVKYHMACSTSGTTTTITIFNDDPSTSSFFGWQATGY